MRTSRPKRPALRPARRRAAALLAAGTAGVLALPLSPAGAATPSTSAGPAGPSSPPAPEAPAEPVGAAEAVTARLGLSVALLGEAVTLPVEASIGEVAAQSADAPEAGTDQQHSTEGTLDTELNGTPDRAVVATRLAASSATSDAALSEAEVRLVDATVRLGARALPGADLLDAEEIHAIASCPADGVPRARVEVVGDLRLAGVAVSLDASGVARVPIPGVGEVTLRLTEHVSHDDRSATTALRLDLGADPLRLGLTEVTGGITLAEASCRLSVPEAGDDTVGASGGAAGSAGSNGSGGTGGSHGSGGSTGGPGGTAGGTSGGGTAPAPAPGALPGTAGAEHGSGTGDTTAPGAGGATSGGGTSGAQPQGAAQTGRLAATGASDTLSLAVAGVTVALAGVLMTVLAFRRRGATARTTRI
ncbi:hypothetical protein [Allostreptomyces psammosilenae]|uniref:Gram-positive cocci surface proteins LPxTG domain-containing protein n=1 Tax=Allostreptomyces psammosilenae TaxID=1892865 RepID=A0A853A2T6_9ACTN|nr:hypothetical protein [Allostreptomyces psammosilenae]NYI05051.1 hypothetical protein [Allostreptomyces psammosilenae]